MNWNRIRVTFTLCSGVILIATQASAQQAANQTRAFGNGRLVLFTYQQNFDCVDQPTMDLDFNGKLAESDPDEMQMPICQAVTEPTRDPAGGKIKQTAHLYVFVPMFSVDNDQNPADAMPCPAGGRPHELCGTALGHALIGRRDAGRAVHQIAPVLRGWPVALVKDQHGPPAMDAAEAAGRAIEVGSNFFLFFSSRLASAAGSR
jgi:hypothetical protein